MQTHAGLDAVIIVMMHCDLLLLDGMDRPSRKARSFQLSYVNTLQELCKWIGSRIRHI